MVKLSKICKCVMASLVVESLFTIISLEETIENCVNFLFLATVFIVK